MPSASPSVARLNELTGLTIASAITVHRALGSGLLETAYCACLCYELQQAGIGFELQRSIPLRYKDVNLNCAYRADLIVENLVVVEVKAVDSLAPIHARQLLTYLKVFGGRVGLILNFGARTMREGIKRVVHDFPSSGDTAEIAKTRDEHG